MKKFLKASELQLINGGYVSNKAGDPVSNVAFVAAQKRAEYVITFAKLAKGKDFKGKKADCLTALALEVEKALRPADTAFVSTPKKPSTKITDSIAKEAMSFMDYGKDVNKAQKVNAFLQEFNILKEFEDFGLFFEDDIAKLDKIYTTKEVVEAVEAVIELL